MKWLCPKANLGHPRSAYVAVSSAGVKIQPGGKVRKKKMQGGVNRIAESRLRSDPQGGVIVFLLGGACSSKQNGCCSHFSRYVPA